MIPRPAAGLVVHTGSPTKTSPGTGTAPVVVELAAVGVVQPSAGQHVGERPGAGGVGPLREQRDRGGGRLVRRVLPQPDQARSWVERPIIAENTPLSCGKTIAR